MEAAEAEFGQDVEKAQVVGGLIVEGLLEASRIKVTQGLSDLSDSDVEGGLVNGGVFVFFKEIEGEILIESPLSDPLLIFEPVLVAAVFPGGKVLFCDDVVETGRVLQVVDDFGVRIAF